MIIIIRINYKKNEYKHFKYQSNKVTTWYKILGYLIPYHPYPFPRYSRLTPAHFASLPTLLEKRRTSYLRPPSYDNSPSECHCYSTSPQSYETTRDSSGRSRKEQNVLPNTRSVERRNAEFEDDEFKDYWQQMHKKNIDEVEENTDINQTFIWK